MSHSTTPDTDASTLLVALKEVLRERRIGYQAIAEAMDLSLPTIKRMLNKTSMPLDRLLQICRLAEIDPVDVFTLAEKKRPSHTMFTPEQDELFFNRPEFLSYFQRLCQSGMTPAGIAAEEDLQPASTEHYLNGLANVGLIERDTGTKVRLLVSPPFGFGPTSKVLRTRSEAFLRDIVNRVLFSEKRDAFAILKPLNLPQDLLKEMLREFSAIVDKYSYLSEKPTARKGAERADWKLAIAAGPCASEERAPIVEI